TVTISSSGKTFNTTGWKVGWLSGPADLVDAVLAVKQYLTYSGGAPFQPAIAVGLGLPDAYFHNAAAVLQAKRDLLSAGLTDAGFDPYPSSGTYFLIADAFQDGEALCLELPRTIGVTAVPVAAFVKPERQNQYRDLVRFAFCKRTDVLEEAVRRLRAR